MNAHITLPHHITLQPLYTGIQRLFKNLRSTLSKWEHNYCSRRALAQVEPYLLKDMGLTKFDVNKEVGKPFWK